MTIGSEPRNPSSSQAKALRCFAMAYCFAFQESLQCIAKGSRKVLSRSSHGDSILFEQEGNCQISLNSRSIFGRVTMAAYLSMSVGTEDQRAPLADCGAPEREDRAAPRPGPK
jgi:hypothetical protein